VKPIGVPVVTVVASAVLVTLRLGGGGGFTTMVARFDGVGAWLSAEINAWFVYVPALEPGGARVALCTCTVALAPGARSKKLQLKVWGGRGGTIVQLPGPAYAGLILQTNPRGSGSTSFTLNAVPVPAALLLLTVIVKPIVVPVGTGVASAVLITLRFGG
jgi:hypothetical protein